MWMVNKLGDALLGPEHEEAPPPQDDGDQPPVAARAAAVAAENGDAFAEMMRSMGRGLTGMLGQVNQHLMSGLNGLLSADVPPQPRKLPIIGVMGSGQAANADLAEPLGVWIAQQGYHLLTGGGQGNMLAVCEAFVRVPDRTGYCLGVLPADGTGRHPREGYPNEYVELPIVTHLSGRNAHAQSRNHINVLTSDVLIALPGSAGTASEVQLAREYGRPVILFLGDAAAGHSIQGLPADIGVPVAQTMAEVAAFVITSLQDPDMQMEGLDDFEVISANDAKS